MSQLWRKAKNDLDARMLRYTAGDDPALDQRLVPHDITASIAHATMLAEGGYLTGAEVGALVGTLEELRRAHAAGEWRIAPEEEDGHTALENQLVARLGPVGERIHLGRSRNDQVLAALRLYLREVCDELEREGAGVLAALDGIRREQGDVPLPGYTHLQRAMPSTVGDWAGGYRSEVADDLSGLAGVRRRLAANPLGSAAGYGVPVIDIDRERTCALLGFERVQEPVTAVQLSRGKAEATLLFEMTLLLQDLGRLASDIVLFATAEFGFVRLAERFTTGSSIMPQKRNPDLFELVRGRAAQAGAELQAVLAIPAKLGSGYHRDLQLIKAPLFRSIDVTLDTLALLSHALPGITFDAERTALACDPSLAATEEAYRLVAAEGIPFREAYRRVAERWRA